MILVIILTDKNISFTVIYSVYLDVCNNMLLSLHLLFFSSFSYFLYW